MLLSHSLPISSRETPRPRPWIMNYVGKWQHNSTGVSTTEGSPKPGVSC